MSCGHGLADGSRGQPGGERLAVSSDVDGVTGRDVKEDRICPPHPEAANAARHARFAQITEQALAGWLKKRFPRAEDAGG